MKAGWLESDRRGTSREKGEHPALGPVPLPVTPARCLIARSSGKTGRAHVAVSAEISARTLVSQTTSGAH